MKINIETLKELIRLYKNDREIIDFIYEAMMSFESYHNTVFDMEIKSKIYDGGILDREDYNRILSVADEKRTLAHNSLIGMVEALNNLAISHELPPVYDDIVSRDQPYRRMLADAVFEWMEEVIKNRI